MRDQIFVQPSQRVDGSWLVSDTRLAAWMVSHQHEVLAVELLTPGEPSSEAQLAFVFANRHSFGSDLRAFADGGSIGILKYLRSLDSMEQLLHDHQEIAESIAIT